MIKQLLGIASQEQTNGAYAPSKLSLAVSTSKTTNYEAIDYPKYQGSRNKVLIIFTEGERMTMENGKDFATGNHPVEVLLPMLHLKNAGFEFEITTPTGKPVSFERWAFPTNDEKVREIYDHYRPQFQQPRSLADFVANSLTETGAYAAIFIPGGHGAMLGIPDDENVAEVITWAHENNLFTLSICHGPAALLAPLRTGKSFLYEGYNLAVFPDSADNMLPLFGYLPGELPWKVGGSLEKAGANVVNALPDDSVCRDRKLITGASPLAANKLGKLAAETLLEAL